MFFRKVMFVAFGMLIGSLIPHNAHARDHIHIVGSSTVYPFTATVAEQFSKKHSKKAPVVESTGTGGGFKLFCGGLGLTFPDVANASRPIKAEETSNCTKNGVTDVQEIKIGIDGLVLVNSKQGPRMSLTLEEVFLAFAKSVVNDKRGIVPNPNKLWSDVNKHLPNIKIEVLGPPPTSGTRDSFHELFLEVAAKKWKDGLSEKDFKSLWTEIRTDGAYVEAGENDNVIVQKLLANKNAIGIFGFSFLDENVDKLAGIHINGVEPTYDNIASGKYVGSRPLFVYVKKQHFSAIKDLDLFVKEYLSSAAIGKDGYLARKGLVPLPQK